MRKLIGALALLVALSGCTWPQMLTLSSMGLAPHDVPSQTAMVEGVPDFPIKLPDRRTIELDGTVSDAPICPSVPTFNSYRQWDAAPVIIAFQAVTCERGWSQHATDSWTPFMVDVVIKESNGCPNILRRQSLTPGTCEVHGPGREDAGFGQVVSVHYRPGGLVCERVGLCSRDSIIADPHSSMLALVVLMEYQGKSPWCYRALRGFHDCSLAPGAKPPAL